MINKMFKRATYIKDFALAFISSMVITVITTFVVNPLLAKHLEINEYGRLLTICGYVAIFSSAIGNSLSNVRLISKSIDSSKNYNILLLAFSLIATFLVGGLAIFYVKCSISETIGVCIYTMLSSLNLYWSVSFRLQINYTRNLIYNCVIGVGYLCGLAVFFIVGFWPIIYLFGQVFGLIYLFIFTTLPREKYVINRESKKLIKPFSCLIGTTFIAQILSLLDRVILYPVLGEVAVSQFNVASFFGKGVGTFLGPIALVLLSYFVKDGFVITKNFFWKVVVLGTSAVLLTFVLSIPVAPFVTKLLYPTIFEESKHFILIANFGAILGALGVLLNPLVLKVCDIKWQPILQTIYGVLYVALGVVGTYFYGIIGFGWSCIISNFIKILLMLLVGGINAK